MIPRQSTPDGPQAGASLRAAYRQDRAMWLSGRWRMAWRNMPWFLIGSLLTGLVVGLLTRFALFGVVFAVLCLLALLDALFRTPGSLVALRAHAAGQVGTARLLRPIQRRGFVILHDRVARSWTGVTGGAIDVAHLVVGPTGVFLIESRNWQSGAKPRIIGAELWRGQESQADTLQALRDAARELSALLTSSVGAVDEADEVPVTPVLAVHVAELPGAPRDMAGVVVIKAEQLARVLETGQRRWSPAVVDRVRSAADDLLVPRRVDEDPLDVTASEPLAAPSQGDIG
jgi:hypothetical protein